MKKQILLLCLALYSFTGSAAATGAGEVSLQSPDGKLEAVISTGEAVSVRLFDNAGALFAIDTIRLETDRGLFPAPGDRVRKVEREHVSREVVPVIREKRASLADNYQEATLRFAGGCVLQVRLYNDGFAYRLLTELPGELIVRKEQAVFTFDPRAKITFQQDHNPSGTCEMPYIGKRIGELTDENMGNLPALVELPASKRLLLLEADAQDYPFMWFRGREGRIEMYHWQFPQSLLTEDIPYNGTVYQVRKVTERCDYIARVAGSRAFPWRAVAIAGEDCDLMRNQLVYLLAPPCRIADPSWIKPGWVIFDWWGKFGIHGVDFEAGINTATAKHMIDFAHDFGMPYFMFDFGWSHQDDLTRTTPGLDMNEVVRYAREKEVGIILWVCYSLLERQMDRAMAQFEQWGIKGLKIDFLDRSDQEVAAFYWQVAEEAARRRLVLNFHGCYTPDGLRRAYPNVLTQEGLIEFEYNGWTDYVSPDHDCTLPFIRNVAGPMDYIPGTMLNATQKSFRMNTDTPMGQGTRAHSIAMAVIAESPMRMLPDAPTAYYREEECARFLSAIPVEWDQCEPLDGRVGDYVALARRNGSEWYVAAITDWDPRTMELDFDFLEEGRTYEMELIKDGINAGVMAVDYLKERLSVRKGDRITIDLAPGGGWVARIY